MNRTLSEIKSPIEAELKEFNIRFKESMKSEVPFLDKVSNYIIKSKGKHMRPMFIFLSAKLLGSVNDNTYHAASLIELLHTATLIHDDVVDESMQRRNSFSLNALWGNKIAVLVGDFLSRGLLLSLENNAFKLLQMPPKPSKMSEGELLQLAKARRLDIEEDIYFKIIRKNSLSSHACSAGASSTGADEETVEKMRLFGKNWYCLSNQGRPIRFW